MLGPPILLHNSKYIPFPKAKPLRKCNAFKRNDWSLVEKEIEEHPFQQYCYSNVNFLLHTWYEWLWSIIDKHVPKTTEHRSKLHPWISSQTSQLMCQLGTLKRK